MPYFAFTSCTRSNQGLANNLWIAGQDSLAIALSSQPRFKVRLATDEVGSPGFVNLATTACSKQLVSHFTQVILSHGVDTRSNLLALLSNAAVQLCGVSASQERDMMVRSNWTLCRHEVSGGNAICGRGTASSRPSGTQMRVPK